MSAAARCPDENEFVALTRGLLDDHAVEALESHIDECPACSALMVELARVVSAPDLCDTASPDSAYPGDRPDRGGRSPRPGERLGDRYDILDLVGLGGMGVVYRATDSRLGRDVAVKLLRPDTARGNKSEGAARLRREARLLATLSHPNVLTVHDVGEWHAQVYLATEFVEGTTLTEWLRQNDLQWREIVALFVQAGRGLTVAHEAGVIHRDVKPDNFMVGRDGRVRVTDFGLARGDGPATPVTSVGSAGGAEVRDDDPITVAGHIMGTPAYMSPEQRRGAALGPASDQFSFFASLYEALHGVRPLQVKHRGKAAGARPPDSSERRADLPPALEAIVERGLSVEPADRHASMAVVVRALEGLVGETTNQPSYAHEAIRTEMPLEASEQLATGSRWSRHWRPWRGRLVLLLVVLGGLALTGGLLLDRAFRVALRPSVASVPQAKVERGDPQPEQPRLRCGDLGFEVGGECRRPAEPAWPLARACLRNELLACVELGIALLGGKEDMLDPALAMAALERGCVGGSGKACYELALVYDEGKHVDIDQQRVERLFERGCSKGHTLSCNDSGVRLARSKDPSIVRKGFARLSEACDNGLSAACYNVAGYYASGRGVPQDMERARTLYDDACSWNHAAACRWLASYLTDGEHTPADLPLAARYWDKGCDLSDAKSCHHLGGVHYGGRGVEIDKPRALRAYRRACTLKHGMSCWNAGYMVRLGKGVPKDRQQAFELLQSGCALGYPKACTFAGRDLIARKQPREAAAAFEVACKGDHALGCYELGLLARDGVGAEEDLARARQLFDSSCEKGVLDACYARLALAHRVGLQLAGGDNIATGLRALCTDREHAESCTLLGQLHAKGEGGAQRDAAAAAKHYERGCQLSDKKACKLLKAVKR